VTERENFLRTVEFRGPRWIQGHIKIKPATWKRHREALEAVVMRHPLVFGEHNPGSINFDDFSGTAYGGGRYAKGEWTDDWGCVWRNIFPGMAGTVAGHPLEDWQALDDYQPPDPLAGWNVTSEDIHQARAAGKITGGGIGNFFERLHFLRGFENFMMDLIQEPPQLPQLISIVLEHNMKIVNRWMAIEEPLDRMSAGDDLGGQHSSLMSLKSFRKWLKPAYTKMFQTCRRHGSHVHMHSDGYILNLGDDLIEAGVSIINPQSGGNTIDGIATVFKDRICVNLDLDRQQVMPYGTPAEVRDHIKEAVVKLGSPAGGLMLLADVYPDTPLENIETMAKAMEEFREYYW